MEIFMGQVPDNHMDFKIGYCKTGEYYRELGGHVCLIHTIPLLCRGAKVRMLMLQSLSPNVKKRLMKSFLSPNQQRKEQEVYKKGT